MMRASMLPSNALALLLIVALLGGCGPDSPEAVPSITVLQRQQVRDEIEAAPEVHRLRIRQDGARVRIELRVQPSCTLMRARELGYDALRLTKELSPDEPPSLDMGLGIYDYEVVVVTDEDPSRLVVRGTKIPQGSIINW